jgi:hypothetical protein
VEHPANQSSNSERGESWHPRRECRGRLSHPCRVAMRPPDWKCPKGLSCPYRGKLTRCSVSEPSEIVGGVTAKASLELSDRFEGIVLQQRATRVDRGRLKLATGG